MPEIHLPYPQSSPYRNSLTCGSLSRGFYKSSIPHVLNSGIDDVAKNAKSMCSRDGSEADGHASDGRQRGYAQRQDDFDEVVRHDNPPPANDGERAERGRKRGLTAHKEIREEEATASSQ